MAQYKLALVSDWYYPRVGGIEYAIDALAHTLEVLGHEVHVLARRYPTALGSEAASGVPVLRFEGSPISEHWLRARTYMDLYRTLESGRYDLVHAHGLDSPLAVAALLIAKRLRIPRIMTSHSLFGKGLSRMPMMWGARWFVRAASAVIAVSSAGEAEARRIYQGSVFHIPNGIDTRSPNGAMEPIAVPREGRMVIATVSRMTRRKGVEDLVEIAQGLARDDLLFLMVGGGPLKEKLESTVERLGLSRRFFFTGSVSRATVLHLLQQADIFVLASRREAFGIAVLEAFLARVPVVAMEGTGVSDIVAHGKTGLLAEDGQAMARYIEDLIARPELREALSAAAYEELERYQWQAIGRQVEEVYSSVLHEQRRHLG